MGSNQRKVPLVTFLTDFGYQDGYVGVMKGVMHAINPDIKIVDISHDIPPHDVKSASFVIGQSYAYFPEGTLHVIIVDPGVGTSRPILYIEAGYYRFLTPDNGLLQYIVPWEKVFRVIHVKNRDHFLPEQSSTFHGRDIFAPVAGYLSKGIDPKVLGDEVQDYQTPTPCEPEVESEVIRGEIVYIDHFGNLITNVSRELIGNILKERKKICIMLAGQKIEELSETFLAKPFGSLVAFIDSSNYLAFAINGQDAAQKMGLSVKDPFEIRIM